MAEPTSPPPEPLVPMVALVLSVIGLCFPPLMLVSIGLGAWGLSRAKHDAGWAAKKPLSQGALLVSAAGLVVFAVMAVPQWRRFGLRAKQQECRTHLYELYAAQTRLHASNHRYTTSLSELDAKPAPGRYLYRLAASGPLWTSGPVDPAATGIGLVAPENPGDTSESIDAKLPSLLRESLGVTGTCPGCTVTLLCAANLDADDTLDVWSISSAERTGADGEKIPPGLMTPHSDDAQD